jgi:hypothetical protein
MATLRCGVADGERMLRLKLPVTIVAPSSERSAARLAHQSGGLGVASSNLAAPTKNFNEITF